MSKRKYQTYVVTETIVIEQEIIARSPDDALEKYNEMMKTDENRVALTKEGCTSSSTTSSEIDVEDIEEHDERVFG
jgi:hypothetical protein